MQFAKIVLALGSLAFASAQDAPAMTTSTIAIIDNSVTRSSPVVVVTATAMPTTTDDAVATATEPEPVTEASFTVLSNTQIVVSTVAMTHVQVTTASLLPSIFTGTTVYPYTTGYSTALYTTTTAPARIASPTSAASGNSTTPAKAAAAEVMVPGMAAIVGGIAAFLA